MSLAKTIGKLTMVVLVNTLSNLKLIHFMVFTTVSAFHTEAELRNPCSTNGFASSFCVSALNKSLDIVLIS